MISLLEVAGVAAALYFGSLLVNPWARCWNCRGRGFFTGWFWTYAHHDCRICRGRKRYVRLGVRVFMPWRAARLRARGR